MSRREGVRSVDFVGAIAVPGERPPQRLPQVAIAGRSNCGKSTLINRLVGRKKIARTSKRPGRTQEINFFRVNERFLIADLPGYGFARAPQEVRERWGPLIETYLAETSELLGIILLADARRGLSSDDGEMLEYLERLGTPTLFVLTKADKLNRAGQRRALDKLQRVLGADQDQTLITSARTGLGVQELWDSILALLQEDQDGPGR